MQIWAHTCCLSLLGCWLFEHRMLSYVCALLLCHSTSMLTNARVSTVRNGLCILRLQWELISGGDLLELLNQCNGCMTETAAAFYYTQLLRGVLHMHVNGYCHR